MAGLFVVISVVATGLIVMISRDGYQVVDIVMAIFTWAVGIAGVWIILEILQRAG